MTPSPLSNKSNNTQRQYSLFFLPDCLVSMVHSYQPLLLSPLDVDRVWWRHSKFPRSRPVSTSVSQSKKMRFFICLYRWVVVHPSDFCLYDLNLFSLFPPVCFDTRFSVYGFGLNFTGFWETHLHYTWFSTNLRLNTPYQLLCAAFPKQLRVVGE